MATVRMLLYLGATFLVLGEISAAPRKYDQRQQGEFNAHLQLENLLFVVAIPNNNDVLSELALQALELKQHLDSGIIPPPPLKEPELDTTLTAFNEPNDEVRGEEIYITSTEAVKTSEDRPNKSDLPQNADEKNPSGTSDQEQATTAKSRSEEEKPEDAEREAKNIKGFEPAKSQETPVILGYLVDTRRILGSKAEDGGRARNVVGNVWNPDVEPGRPGTSMKKQLFRRGLSGEDVASSATTLVGGGGQQELKLLGDGIENCGPGRHRDASGVCGFDKSADSPL